MADEVLRKFSYGLYVLGVKAGDIVNGMTASLVSQVSIDPPRVMVAVHRDRFTHGLVKEAGIFSLSVLRKDQAHLMGKFKGSKEVTDNAINGVEIEYAGGGVPVLKESAGYVVCRLSQMVDAGDHTIFIGDVEESVAGEGPALNVEDLGGHTYGG
ncbi:MAG TPA: flavin reductase family protein [bacterium]|nr:flavin reductase family protein [bacterium]